MYRLAAPRQYQSYVLKRYHPEQQTAAREAKLRQMMAFPPEISDPRTVMWPEVLVYENEAFVGFLMKKARGEYDLTVLTSLRMSERLGPEWLAAYDRQSPEGLAQRGRICLNLAYAVSQIHTSGLYLLADLKPENIKVSLDAQVSLIDMDSVVLRQNEQWVFQAEKFSPEYAPPEIKDLSRQAGLMHENWDAFSMAIVLYKILLGLHPFAGTGRGELSRLVTLPEKIQAGLFPHGSRARDLQVVPAPHQNFRHLPSHLQKLFIQTFDEALYHPSARPTAHDWYRGLQNFSALPLRYKISPPAEKPEQVAYNLTRPVRQLGKFSDYLVWIFSLNFLEDVFLGTSQSYFLYVGIGSALLLFNRLLTGFSIDKKARKIILHQKHFLGYSYDEEVPFDKLYCDTLTSRRKIRIRFYKKTSASGRKLMFQMRFAQSPEEQQKFGKMALELQHLGLLSREVTV
ncbi:MAG: hypothetical protein HC913_09240 [Microscillaceae bacterium]|nr:hypothetical protein [Microscillaceae bacterium]